MQLRLISDAVPSLISYVDRDHYFRFANRSYSEWFGRPIEDIVGRHIGEILGKSAYEVVRPHVDAVFAGRSVTYESLMPYQSGGQRFVHTNLVPDFDREGAVQGFVACVTDITERREMERRLEESGQRYRSLVDQNSDAVFSFDLAGVFVSANEACERLSGYSVPELLGTSFVPLVVPEDRERAMAHFLAATVGEAQNLELAISQRGGDRVELNVTAVPILVHGEVVGVYGVARDVTERKRAEERLQQAYERERGVAEALQRSLLMAPPPNVFPSLTIKPFYEPAWDEALVGGDFYDVFAVDENHVVCVVGDVTGKGLIAATFTAEIKFALRAYLREFAHPAVALARLNNFVVDSERLDAGHAGPAYVTVVCAIVDVRTGDVVCSVAGMDPPFVLRREGGDATPFRAGGPVIGMAPRTEFETDRCRMSTGDLLVISTDGIIEARRRVANRTEFFGYDGLIRTVRECCASFSTLTAIGGELVDRVRSFAVGKQQDDLCVLLVRWEPRDASGGADT